MHRVWGVRQKEESGIQVPGLSRCLSLWFIVLSPSPLFLLALFTL